jgi:hypothetical protein
MPYVTRTTGVFVRFRAPLHKGGSVAVGWNFRRQSWCQGSKIPLLVTESNTTPCLGSLRSLQPSIGINSCLLTW